MSQIFTINDLSKIIHKSTNSIRSDLIRNPKCLPPHFKIPGSRRVLFRAQDVDTWIASFVVHHEAIKLDQPIRRRGRPRKVEQLAAQ